MTKLDLTSDTVSSNNLLSGHIATGSTGDRVSGSIAFKQATYYTPGSLTKIISSGQYLAGDQTIEGSPNLISSNIRQGVYIFGVRGSYVGQTEIDGSNTFAQQIIARTISGDIMLDSAAQIGSHGFHGCSRITAVYAPSCYDIYDYAFQDCTSLTSVSFPICGRIGSNAFRGCGTIENIYFPRVDYMYPYAFESTEIHIDSSNSFPSMTSVWYYAFAGCRVSDIRSEGFPNCTVVGSYAFASCYSLSRVEMSKVTTIYSCAFARCERLSVVSFPSVTSIWLDAFSSCILSSNTIFPMLSFISSCAFRYCSLSLVKSTMFPNCSYISYGGFAYCQNLKYVYMPSCKSISMYAFSGCRSLSGIYLPMCDTVSFGAFIACSKLSNVVLPACISIYGSAFSSCSALHTLTVYNPYISNSVFFNCNRLMSVYVLNSSSGIEPIYSATFVWTPIGGNSSITGEFGSIFVRESLFSYYLSAEGWSYYSERIVSCSDSMMEQILSANISVITTGITTW